MSKDIRPNISKKSRYYLSVHRYYELVHFCLQYHEWEAGAKAVLGEMAHSKIDILRSSGIEWSKPTEEKAIALNVWKKKMDLVELSAKEADPSIWKWLLRSVTDDLSYGVLYVEGIPCGRDYFYERRRKLLWILSKKVDDCTYANDKIL